MLCGAKMISVIIPTIKGREDLLKRLLASLPKDCEVIVVPDEDLLLAAKRNKGAARAKGEYLLFIDDDNYLKDGAIDRLRYYFNREMGIIGMVGHYATDPDRIWDGGSNRNYLTGFTSGIGINKLEWDGWYWCYQVDEVANAFMIRRELFEKVGGFDEKRFPIDLDEADLCIRIKKMGYTVNMCPKAICYHKSITYSRIPNFRRPMNAYYMSRNKILFQRKHLNYLNYAIYLIVFMPMTVMAYILCLLYRKKPIMIYWFLKGVKDGLQGRLKN